MFFKNTAGQHVPCQMNSRTDGSPLTSGVSVAVKVDGGAQGAGTGTLTHVANGGWDYIPTQAETNGDVLAFQFTHATGINQTLGFVTREAKVPVTLSAADVTGNVAVDLQTIKTQSVTCAAGVTVLASVGTASTSTAQSGDSYTRIGAAGAGLTALGDARLANLDTNVGSRSTYAGGDTSGTTTLLSRITAAPLLASNYTAPDNASISAIKAKTDNLPAAPADESLIIAATNSIKSDTGAIKAKTDQLAFTAGTVNANATATVDTAAIAAAVVVAIGSTAGSGSVLVNLTVTVGGSPVDGVAVFITTDSAGVNIVAGSLYTDALGKVSFLLDPGVYYVWKQRSGTNFTNPERITVTA